MERGWKELNDTDKGGDDQDYISKEKEWWELKLLSVCNIISALYMKGKTLFAIVYSCRNSQKHIHNLAY
jgi:hypothetical protein